MRNLAGEKFDNRFVDPWFRSSKLGPGDRLLKTGMYLSNSPYQMETSTTLEMTELGGVLVSAGHMPDRTQEPLYAYDETGSFCGRANGCLICVVESL